MQIWEPRGCCCCFDLRVGSLILSSLTLAGCILNILHSCVGTLAVQVQTICMEVLTACKDDPNGNQCSEETNTIVLSIVITNLVLYTIYGCIAILLIHAIRKRQPEKMIPYMAWTATHITLVIIFFLALIAILNKPVLVASFAIAFGLVVFLETYFLLVIRAHYLEIRRAQSQDHRRLEEEKQY